MVVWNVQLSIFAVGFFSISQDIHGRVKLNASEA